MDKFGSSSSDFVKSTKNIGKKLNNLSGENRSKNFMTQWMSAAIQRKSAECVVCTVPKSKSFEKFIFFYLFNNL